MAGPIRAEYNVPWGGQYGAPRAGGRTHQGTDYHCPVGTPIYATGDGHVSANVGEIGYGIGFGNYVSIVYPGGRQTLDGHIRERSSLSVGTPVNADTIVGYVGLTGNSVYADPPGAHDHHQVWLNGVLTNPAAYYGTTTAGGNSTPLPVIPSPPPPPPPPYLAPLEDDMFKLYYRKDAPTTASPSGVTYALGVLDPSWATPGHNFWFESSAESRRDWRELFGFRDADGVPQAQLISADIWNARSNDANRIGDVSKYLPVVSAAAQITNITAAPLSDVDIKRIVLALQAAIPAAAVPVPLAELSAAVAKATLDAQAQRLLG